MNRMNRPDKNGRRKLREILRRAVALAAALIIAGCFDGSVRDVLVKAVNICSECIGLG